MRNIVDSSLRTLAVSLLLLAMLPAIVYGGDFHAPPYKLGRQSAPPYTHLQLDNDRQGLAIEVQSSTRAAVFRIDPEGVAHPLTRIDGRIESIQINTGHDRACAYVKDDDGVMTRWYLSTRGESWTLRDPSAKFFELDSLPDGKVLLAEKLTSGVALQLRAADGAELGRIILPGESFKLGNGDSAGNPLQRFALLRDASGVIEHGQVARTGASTRTAIVARFWDGETLASWIPGLVLGYRGFDRDRIFIQGEGDSLFVVAAGGAPQPVELHGQAVRGLDWAGDGTLRMTHGNAAFVAESYLQASGEAKAQWVRPRHALASGLRRSALGPPLAQLDRAGTLSGQAWWSGSVRSSYLSDDFAPDTSMVVVLDGTRSFAPDVYPWPDDAAYSPDMRWVLRLEPSGQYAITAARPLAEARAVALLKRLQP